MSTKSPFVDANLSETLRVYTNGSDEIFVEHRKSKVVIRISDNVEQYNSNSSWTFVISNM